MGYAGAEKAPENGAYGGGRRDEQDQGRVDPHVGGMSRKSGEALKGDDEEARADRLAHGESARTFQANVDYAVGEWAVSVTAGDWNGDKKLDLAVANHGRGGVSIITGNVSILLGNGDGTFQAKVDYAAGRDPNSMTAGDWNGDGNLDLAVANGHVSGGVSILLGNGNGTFQAKVDYATGDSPRSVTAGDWNGDKKLDLAVANVGAARLSDDVSILLNTSQ